ncbi:MAG: YdcH family protein [Minwuia sp.]|uniref:YdcH family protein n=1 Tax=Minwuia sp. TaxID=2493630 RepID=UPI003A8AC149
MTEVSGESRHAVEQRVAELKLTHNDLDAAIEALGQKGSYDDLQMQRMKRRKLQLKDEICRLEAMLSPDIIA